jgi:hypothetical protein
MYKERFCPECGAAYGNRPRYPGGDPENGPAELRCPLGHQTVKEIARSDFADTIQTDYLTCLSVGYRDDPFDLKVPFAVEQAALLILAHRGASEAHWNGVFQAEDLLADEDNEEMAAHDRWIREQVANE